MFGFSEQECAGAKSDSKTGRMELHRAIEMRLEKVILSFTPRVILRCVWIGCRKPFNAAINAMPPALRPVIGK